MVTRIKTTAEIVAMRTSGRLLANVLSKLGSIVEPGMTTGDLNEIAKQELRGTGGVPAFLGYQGFPGAVCTSLNDEVVHGIPGKRRKIRDGDLLSMDFGVVFDGMITDSALSLIVGKPISKQQIALVRDTEAALDAGIWAIKSGATTGDIGYSIEQVLKRAGYGIVRDMVGHGVGHELHEEPNIPNYGKKGSGFKLSAGMTIAVEPMATLGDHSVFIDRDDWTVKTQDGSLSAHFEHTILITENGSEVLTKR